MPCSPLAAGSRRAPALILTLSLFLIGAVLVPYASAASAATTVRYVSPTGAGLKNGSSWANAATLSKINALAGALPAGGEIWLRADQGAYTTGSTIVQIYSSGGVAGNPVRIRGVDLNGNALPAQFKGTRTTPYSRTGAVGSELFRLLPGANHLAFSDMEFRDYGNGVFRFGGNVNDISIDDMRAYNVRRFIETMNSGSNPSSTVTNVTVDNVEVHGYSKSAIHFQYDSNAIVLQNILLDSENQDGDDFAIGVHLEHTTHDVLIRNVTSMNNQATTDAYWNGDGFATENATYDITFQDTLAQNNYDGGYDLKSDTTSLINAASAGNKRNYRFWGAGIDMTGCTATSPIARGGMGSQAQVWAGSGANVSLHGCAISDDSAATSVFQFEGTAIGSVDTSTVVSNPLAKLFSVETTASLLFDGTEY